MIPDTVFGLLVIAAGLGPGYLFVRLGELRNPRPNRSTLLELAELVTVGGSCTVVVRERSVIARWEQGAVAPSIETLVELVRACGFDLPLELVGSYPR